MTGMFSKAGQRAVPHFRPCPARKSQIGRRDGKGNCIIVVAEGDRPEGAFEVAKEVKTITGLDSRVVILEKEEVNSGQTI